MRVLDVGPDNVGELGFFCYMSKKKSPGYARKMSWLERRFDEGLRIKMLELPDRGFIEYIPGEYAWRTVDARGFFFIHCLWVVGKSKGKGFADALLDLCIDDARQSGAAGVAMVTSEKNWLVGRQLFEKKGFVRVAEAPPAFSLMVNAFGDHRPPAFIDTSPAVRREFGRGLTVFRSDQCPYIESAVESAASAAASAGIDCRVVLLESAAEVRRISPSPYGTFGLVLDGELLGYHLHTKKALLEAFRGR